MAQKKRKIFEIQQQKRINKKWKGSKPSKTGKKNTVVSNKLIQKGSVKKSRGALLISQHCLSKGKKNNILSNELIQKGRGLRLTNNQDIEEQENIRNTSNNLPNSEDIFKENMKHCTGLCFAKKKISTYEIKCISCQRQYHVNCLFEIKYLDFNNISNIFTCKTCA